MNEFGVTTSSDRRSSSSARPSRSAPQTARNRPTIQRMRRDDPTIDTGSGGGAYGGMAGEGSTVVAREGVLRSVDSVGDQAAGGARPVAGAGATDARGSRGILPATEGARGIPGRKGARGRGARGLRATVAELA